MKLMSCSLALLAGLMAAAPAMAKEGPVSVYAEARLGYETPTISDGSVYKLGNSASVGLEVGGGINLSRSTNLGAFVNYDYAKSQTCEYGYCLGSDGNLAYGAKLQFRVGERLRLYGKLGGDNFSLRASIPGATATKQLNGVMGAIGMNYDLSRHVYLGAEVNYADLGQFAGSNFQRRHAALTAGIRY